MLHLLCVQLGATGGAKIEVAGGPRGLGKAAEVRVRTHLLIESFFGVASALLHNFTLACPTVPRAQPVGGAKRKMSEAAAAKASVRNTSGLCPAFKNVCICGRADGQQ